MKKIKDITLIGMFVAILIGGQWALSSISGVEVITVLLLCFSYVFGWKRGVLVATTFSILRCFIFGFFIQVIILYLIYYNIFALYFGLLGRGFTGKVSIKRYVLVVVSAVIFTVLFTLLDNVITPFIYGFNESARTAYFWTSIYAAIPQTICTIITVTAFFKPLTKVLYKCR